MNTPLRCFLVFLAAGVLGASALAAGFRLKEDATSVQIETDNYRIDIQKEGFRYRFARADGSPIVAAHATSGLEFGGGVASNATLAGQTTERIDFQVVNNHGARAKVAIEPREHHARFLITVESGKPGPIVARTGGASPAYGLGDPGGMGRDRTELTGYTNEQLRALSGSLRKIETATRLMSTFVIFPRHGLAEVCFEPRSKIVRFTTSENALGSAEAVSLPPLYYFFGSPQIIYREFLAARNREGYKVYPPKYDWFGLGWEAWGALAWDTNQKTVTENVERYLELGYPLRWMVVGSGFWPRHDERFHATTSFGLWDEKLYPDPRGFIRHFHERGLKFIIGLRIAFIVDGPYTEEGLKRRVFIQENGESKVFKISFPKKPCYLLDAQNPAAVSWYLSLCEKWLDYGIDGFKEDLFGYTNYPLRDDKIDPVNAALMERGVLLMGRNGFAGSPMDIHRIEDFNNDQNQDRGPLNCLALAYSGFHSPYPDLVGGTFLISNTDVSKRPQPTDPKVHRYYLRAAQFCSVTPVMAMGYGPWNFKSAELERVVLAAAKLHGRLQPYLHSAAVESTRDGFPHTMTPLPLVFPDDPEVHQLENTTRRGYQWMLGPSLLAVPLFGDDYPTAQTRDVYLPAGSWIDFDTGETHRGPRTLKGFALPPGKTPLFIGGKGVLVLRELDGEDLHAVVYPIAPDGSEYDFTDRDGKTRSKITRANSGWSLESVIVMDVTENKRIPHTVEKVGGGIRFPLIPGHDYRLTSGGAR